MEQNSRISACLVLIYAHQVERCSKVMGVSDWCDNAGTPEKVYMTIYTPPTQSVQSHTHTQLR